MRAMTTPAPPSSPPTALVLYPALLEELEAGAAVPLALVLAVEEPPLALAEVAEEDAELS